MAYILLILALILALIQIPDLSLKHPKIKPWVVLLISVVFCVLSVMEAIKQERAENYKRNYGTLDGSFTSHKKRVPIISVGTANFIIGKGNKGLTSDINLWEENDELYMSTTLRAPNGEIVAEMVANRWQLNRNNIFDRNFDRRSIEVKNNKNQIVLQVRYDGEKANLAGIFYDKWGMGMAFYHDTLTGGSIIRTFDGAHEPDIYIKPIFKYPSEDFPGERISY